jgi:hypothetical protein
MQYSLIQRIFTVETYIRKKLYEKHPRKLQGISVPSKSTIQQTMNKYGRPGSSFFQQGDATAHKFHNSVVALQNIFWDQIHSCPWWPAHLPQSNCT